MRMQLELDWRLSPYCGPRVTAAAVPLLCTPQSSRRPPPQRPGSRALLVPDRDDLPYRHRGRDPGRLKDADWILRRAPIEKLTLKGGGRAELIMTRQGRDAMELLEGLTSNVFVFYEGGTLKNKI